MQFFCIFTKRIVVTISTLSPVFNKCDFCCVLKISYTLNRYTSEDFTSIFNEKSQPYSSASYTDLVMEEEQVVEEVIMVESEIIMDVSSTGALYFLYSFLYLGIVYLKR